MCNFLLVCLAASQVHPYITQWMHANQPWSNYCFIALILFHQIFKFVQTYRKLTACIQQIPWLKLHEFAGHVFVFSDLLVEFCVFCQSTQFSTVCCAHASYPISNQHLHINMHIYMHVIHLAVLTVGGLPGQWNWKTQVIN